MNILECLLTYVTGHYASNLFDPKLVLQPQAMKEQAAVRR